MPLEVRSVEAQWWSTCLTPSSDASGEITAPCLSFLVWARQETPSVWVPLLLGLVAVCQSRGRKALRLQRSGVPGLESVGGRWEITNPASPWGRGTFPAPFLPKGLGLRFVPDF